MSTKNNRLPMNPEQVKQMLKFIAATQSEQTQREIFTQLGRDCFQCSSRMVQWVDSYTANPQTFFDWVNVDQQSPHWESLVYTEDQSAIVLTGRVVENCACAFADCSEPPLALCNHCCKNFQVAFFERLLGQEVEVEITEAFLLGDERCSTIIHLR